MSLLKGALSLQECTQLWAKNTRAYAKRQLTWFKRERDVIWADKSVIGQNGEKIMDFMLGCLREKEII